MRRTCTWTVTLLLASIETSANAAEQEADEAGCRQLIDAMLSHDAAAQKNAYEHIKNRPACIPYLVSIIRDTRIRPLRNRDSQGTNKRAVIYAAWALGHLKAESAVGPLADMLAWFALPDGNVDSNDYMGDLSEAYPAVRGLQGVGVPAVRELLERVATGEIRQTTELFLAHDTISGAMPAEEGRDYVRTFTEGESDPIRRGRLANVVFAQRFGLSDSSSRSLPETSIAFPQTDGKTPRLTEHPEQVVTAVAEASRVPSGREDARTYILPTDGKTPRLTEHPEQVVTAVAEASRVPSGREDARTYILATLVGGLAVGAAVAWLLLRRRSGG